MRTLLGVLALAVALSTGGAVARQALQINAGAIVGWRCPQCGTANASDPTKSFRADCRRCAAAVDWSEIEPATGDLSPFLEQ
ncbi:MAG: hypothetical protein H0T47_02195 [Planctomycetaceae bacterium]|nr:hypothetical protein [Planctomycetaceae bacterium]